MSILKEYRLFGAGQCELVIDIGKEHPVRVRPSRNQIIVWITVTEPEVAVVPSLRRIPAIFDTGFGGTLLISDIWLRNGIGLNPSSYFLIDDKIHYAQGLGAKTPYRPWTLDVWLYPEVGGPHANPPDSEPIRLGGLGQEVFVFNHPPSNFNLPLLGIAAFLSAGITVSIDNGIVKLSIR